MNISWSIESYLNQLAHDLADLHRGPPNDALRQSVQITFDLRRTLTPWRLAKQPILGASGKDSHNRQQSGDHAGATAAGEREAQPHHAASAHDRLRAGEDALAGDDAAIVTPSARERATLAGLGEKLAHWLANPTLLTPEDWEILAPIALRLRDLLRHLNE